MKLRSRSRSVGTPVLVKKTTKQRLSSDLTEWSLRSPMQTGQDNESNRYEIWQIQRGSSKNNVSLFFSRKLFLASIENADYKTIADLIMKGVNPNIKVREHNKNRKN
jgi:hypothetical protein